MNFSFLPFISYFYVKTAGISLKEIDPLFAIKFSGGSSMSYKETTRLAREEIRLDREEPMKESKQDANTVEISHVDTKEAI